MKAVWAVSVIASILILSVFALSQDVFGHGTDAYDHDGGKISPQFKTWMSALSDDSRISELSIPGTHDTMARFGGSATETQVMKLREQLESGIRALDIRVRYENISPLAISSPCSGISVLCHFRVYHGPIYQNANFETHVMNEVLNFLSRNPSETVIMNLQQENPNTGSWSPHSDFQTAMDNYLNPIRQEKKILARSCVDGVVNHLKTNNIKLEDGTGNCDARGKLVIMSDGWENSPSANTIGKRGDLVTNIQPPNNASSYSTEQNEDEISLNSGIPRFGLYNKWNAVETHLKRAIGIDDFSRNFLWINFLSATGEITGLLPSSHPYFIASGHWVPSTGASNLWTGEHDSGEDRNSQSDFPRNRCWFNVFIWATTCYTDYEGINVLAERCIRGWRVGESTNYKYFGEFVCFQAPLKDSIHSGPHRLGILFMDFPGPRLIDAIIDVNDFKIDTGGPYETNEGTPITLTGCITRPEIFGCDVNPIAYLWSKWQPGCYEIGHAGSTHVCSQPQVFGKDFVYTDVDDQKNVNILLDGYPSFGVITPENLLEDHAFTGITVKNVPPTPAITILDDSQVRFSATDPGTLDQEAGFRYEIHWGDTPFRSFAFSPPQPEIIEDHQYETPGMYVISLIALDKDRGVSSTSAKFSASDSDGIPDDQDNCPYIENPDQLDSDLDGIGDVCDDFGSDVEIDVISIENPTKIAVDSLGNIFVANFGQNRISKIEKDTGEITIFGQDFRKLVGLGVDSLGNVYVGDASGVHKFTNDGEAITNWKVHHDAITVINDLIVVSDHFYANIIKYNPDGTELATIELHYSASDLAGDPNGNIYILDEFNHLIRRITIDGIRLSELGNLKEFILPQISTYTVTRPFGTNDGEFNHPSGIAVGTNYKVFVADTNNNRIQIFNNFGGEHELSIGTFGTNYPGQFNFPKDVAVDKSGKLYVADTGNNRIQIFSGDKDVDGIGDSVDNCPLVINPDQEDTDGDGIGDACDLFLNDFDNDGVDDSVDNCPLIANPDQQDTDEDGIGDVCQDTDNDGLDDPVDNCPLIANLDQQDTDEDGIGDVCDLFPNDTDNDGLINPEDNCPLIANLDQQDTDEDGIGDECDLFLNDFDNDGIDDPVDNCQLVANPTQTDLDSDGVGDVCDLFLNDFDNDGFDNSVDNCRTTFNPDQQNTDEDGHRTWYSFSSPSSSGDACSEDIDGDSSNNSVDNCPPVWNLFQEDMNGDGIGDVCQDVDIDNDGINNSVDNCLFTANPDQQDTDGDTIGDVCDPFPQDLDNDGVDNAVDNCPLHRNPSQSDGDGDGIGNNCDNDLDNDGHRNGSADDNCTLVANPDQLDSDLDGIGDVCDPDFVDTDGDGIKDTLDNCPFTSNADQLDTDGDGVGDVCDNCPNTPNLDQIDNNDDGIGGACELGDIIISSFVISDPISPIEGDLVTFDLTIKNNGDAALENHNNAFVVLFDDEITVGFRIIPDLNLPPGALISFSPEFQYSEISAGLHSFRVVVDLFDDIEEANKENNVSILPVTIPERPLPDLDITTSDIGISTTSPLTVATSDIGINPIHPLATELMHIFEAIRNVGTAYAAELMHNFETIRNVATTDTIEPTHIFVVIRNVGVTDATDVTVRLEINSVHFPPDQIVSLVPAGCDPPDVSGGIPTQPGPDECPVVEFTVNIGDELDRTVTVIVDPPSTQEDAISITERNESNNRASRTLVVELVNNPTTPSELIEFIDDLDLDANVENNLIGLVKNAQDKLDDDNPKNDGAACGKIDAFINMVNAQDGKKLTSGQAGELRDAAQSLKDSMGC